MSHQFKSGDLAMIVGAFNVPDNIGQQCELIEYLRLEDISAWVDPADGRRVQNAADGPAWLVVGEGLKSWCGSTGWVLADERHLMPLRGDFAPADELSQVVPA
ncbi:hypothetical protein [Pseudomonas sp. DSP3-2-2]|uniref:hypothetical protein n=1 Tax=unclassified Pseudomonas TaxID=196821 RepID=UPI003CF97389